jgi:hypothetical protein
VEVGHAPPYEPLRSVGIPQIDRIKPPRRAAFRSPCRQGRFEVRRRLAQVRIGRGPLIARVRARPEAGVEVRIRLFGIE